jgi:hypothetical protein
MSDQSDLKKAHGHSSDHRAEVLVSQACGCFYCLETFMPGAIREWVDPEGEEGTTALCPHCGIDAVIGSASGFPITAEFLGRMRAYWFSEGTMKATRQ